MIITSHLLAYTVLCPVCSGCVSSGLIADSRTMIDRARVEAQVCIVERGGGVLTSVQYFGCS